MQLKPSPLDLAAVAACALIWGTTWHAIKLQLGVVDPLVSVVYRFGIAALLLLGACAVARYPVILPWRQQRIALGAGFCIVTVDYACVYQAEVRVASAVVAIVFGSAAFINLIAFRVFYAQRAAPTAWLAATLGAAGVGLLSWSEVTHSGLAISAVNGIALAFVGVLGAVAGNLFALRGERAGTPLLTFTGWSMLYGAVLLALYDLASGRHWRFQASAAYVGSLLYLAVLGSVVAFWLYFGLARRRGYTLAAYVTALTPPIAMLMSSLYESKRWGPSALAGVALVMLGQWMLLRSPWEEATQSAAALRPSADR